MIKIKTQFKNKSDTRTARNLKTLILIIVTGATLACSGMAYAAPSSGAGSGGGSGTPTPYTPSPDPAASTCGTGKGQDDSCHQIFSEFLLPAVNLLSAAVGIVTVAMIIFGGIEFSTSGGDPERVTSGKKHITNALIALVAFIFLWAFLNFIIPGGILNAGTS